MENGSDGKDVEGMDKSKTIALVKKAQSGDNTAFGDLFSEVQNDLYFYALKMVKNVPDAEDAIQNTAIEIYKSIGTLQQPEYFKTWATRICHHICCKHFRTTKVSTVSVDDEESYVNELPDEDKSALPEELLESNEFKDIIDRMIDELPDTQRSCLLLYYFEEWSIAEISNMLDIPEGTVKSNLNYARKKLKACVNEYEEKHQIKLHSIGILPLLLMLRDQHRMTASFADQVAAKAIQAAGSSVQSGSSKSGEKGSLMKKGLSESGRRVLQLSKVRIALGVLVVVAVVAGTTVWVYLSAKSKDQDINDASMSESSNMPSVEDVLANTEVSSQPAVSSTESADDVVVEEMSYEIIDQYAENSVARRTVVAFADNDKIYPQSEDELVDFENKNSNLDDIKYGSDEGQCFRDEVLYMVRAKEWISNTNAKVQVTMNKKDLHPVSYSINGIKHTVNTDEFVISNLPNGVYDILVELENKNHERITKTIPIKKDDVVPTTKVISDYTPGTYVSTPVSLFAESPNNASLIRYTCSTSTMNMGYTSKSGLSYGGQASNGGDMTFYDRDEEQTFSQPTKVYINTFSEAGLAGNSVEMEIYCDTDEPYINITNQTATFIQGNLGDETSKIVEAYYTLNGNKTKISVDEKTNRGYFNVSGNFQTASFEIYATDSAGNISTWKYE